MYLSSFPILFKKKIKPFIQYFVIYFDLQNHHYFIFCRDLFFTSHLLSLRGKTMKNADSFFGIISKCFDCKSKSARNVLLRYCFPKSGTFSTTMLNNAASLTLGKHLKQTVTYNYLLLPCQQCKHVICIYAVICCCCGSTGHVRGPQLSRRSFSVA